MFHVRQPPVFKYIQWSDQVKVTVEVTSWFKRFTGGQTIFNLELDMNATALTAILATGIPEDEIGIIRLEAKNSSGENKLADKEHKLADGDIIKVYPLIIGG